MRWVQPFDPNNPSPLLADFAGLYRRVDAPILVNPTALLIVAEDVRTDADTYTHQPNGIIEFQRTGVYHVEAELKMSSGSPDETVEINLGLLDGVNPFVIDVHMAPQRTWGIVGGVAYYTVRGSWEVEILAVPSAVAAIWLTRTSGAGPHTIEPGSTLRIRRQP